VGGTENVVHLKLLEDVQSPIEVPNDKSDIRYYLFMHPDNASDVILEELQNRLREKG